VAIADALQLEAAWAAPELSRFNYDERNRAIHGGVIAISIFDLMTSNMCYVLRSALG